MPQDAGALPITDTSWCWSIVSRKCLATDNNTKEQQHRRSPGEGPGEGAEHGYDSVYDHSAAVVCPAVAGGAGNTGSTTLLLLN